MDDDRVRFGKGFDTGKPSSELQRVLKEGWFQPGRMLEIGCGTGTNAVFLAAQGFDVTAVERDQEALEQAKAKASTAGVSIRFIESDVLQLPDLGPLFSFIFGRGVYHALRLQNRFHCWEVLARVTQPGGFYLALEPSANVRDPRFRPRSAIAHYELCLEAAPLFDLVSLREFSFDHAVEALKARGLTVHPVGWSALFRRTERLVRPETSEDFRPGGRRHPVR
jgi:SAM-dependent methyltransferase